MLSSPTNMHLVRVWYTDQPSPVDMVAEPMGFSMKMVYKIQVDDRSLSKLEIHHSFLRSKYTLKVQNAHGCPGRLLKPLCADWSHTTGTTMVEFDNFATPSTTGWVVEIVRPKLEFDYSTYPPWSIMGACQQAECSPVTLSHDTDRSSLGEGIALMLHLYRTS